MKENNVDVKKAGLAVGLTWGCALFFVGLLGAVTGTFGLAFINAIGSVYVGYTPTYLGSVIGAAYGFVDGAIAGAIVAYLYNML